MPPTVEAITLDAAGTLFRLAEPVGETYAVIGRRHGIDLPPAGLERAFRAAWKQVTPLHSPPLAPPSSPTDSDLAERRWWRGLVESTFQAASEESKSSPPPPDQMAGLFESLFAEFGRPERWRLYPETLKVLDELATRVRLAVISNFDRRFHSITHGLGLHDRFEIVVLSGETGVAKPGRGIFDEARSRLDLPAGRILHAGDDPEADWRGSREAGFQTFELRRPGTSLEGLLELL